MTGGRFIATGDGHELHVAVDGEPGAPAAVYLHGGPGSGCQPAHAALFAGTGLRVVLPDQRGAGQSRPHRARNANTTAHLVADLERIRSALAIERWMLVGGSWGATLALAYAEAHPARVAGLVLRAVFLGTRSELDWAFGEGLRRFRPELWEQFLSALPESGRATPLDTCWRLILGTDAALARRAAFAWAGTERILSEIRPSASLFDDTAAADPARPVPATALMEAHYFSHGCFLAEDQLLREAGRLRGIPGRLIQGRHDLLCPPATSARLAAAWPEARVTVVEGAGHALSDPGVSESVAAAIRELAVAAR